MSEVRRCRCGEASATVGREWGDGGFLGLAKGGAPTGRRDFVCQSCGYRFTIQPARARLLGGGCFSLMFLGFAGMGLIGGLIAGLAEGNFGGLVMVPVGLAIGLPLLWWATGPWRAQRRHPVVPGAPVPPTRFSLEEPARRCSCGRSARCTHVLQWRKAGLNLGREMTYSCGSCSREFTIDSTFGTISTLAGSLLVGAFGGGIMTTAPGQGAGAWACSGIIALVGVGGLAMGIWRLVMRIRHPEIGASVGVQSERLK